MLISDRFKIFKSYNNFLASKSSQFEKINLKRVFLNFYKSDLIVIFE